jgi:hypothetical protein
LIRSRAAFCVRGAQVSPNAPFVLLRSDGFIAKSFVANASCASIRQETASMTNDHAGSAATLNYDEHEKTFKLFVRLLAFAAAGVAGILILLAIIAG